MSQEQSRINPKDVIEIKGLDVNADNLQWDDQQKGFVLDISRAAKAHVEVFGAGGGGGGSYRGHNGGSGGGAGEHKFKELDLTAGKYVLQVGAGGIGGRGHQRNEADIEPTAGGSSAFKSGTGFTYIHCKGGTPGTKNGSGSHQGENGRDVLSEQGEVVTKGGRGGDPDRNGHDPEKGQWGAGGGGVGGFAGPENHRAGSGAPGRINVHFLP